MFDQARRAKRSKIGFRLDNSWTYDDVVQVVQRAQIDALASKLSSSTSGSIPYLTHYKSAVKMIKEDLSEASRSKYHAMAKKWTREGPPPSEQIRCVHISRPNRWQALKLFYRESLLEKHNKRTFCEIIEAIYKQFGMRVVIFAAFRDREGDAAMS